MKQQPENKISHFHIIINYVNGPQPYRSPFILCLNTKKNVKIKNTNYMERQQQNRTTS